MIKSSFADGVFPDLLKVGRITPICKGDEREDFSCYRLISILPTFSKVYERSMYNRICDYVESNKMLDEAQWTLYVRCCDTFC